MIRSIFFSPGKPTRIDIPPQEFPRLIRDRRGLLWVDFVGEPSEVAMPILQALIFTISQSMTLFRKHMPQKLTIGATIFTSF